MDPKSYRAVVARANLAPSIHNAQPTRWRMRGEAIEIAADLAVHLPQADPLGRGVALSVGAAVETSVLALGGADVTVLWDRDDRDAWPGHRMAARLTPNPDACGPLADQLENRMTWRGAFSPDPVSLFGWDRKDMRLVLDVDARAWIAALNDEASLRILSQPAFRKELLSWMRLSPRHPRYRFDGLSSDNLRLAKGDAKRVKLGLGPVWSLLQATGRAAGLVNEADLTNSAPVIALFHAPLGACPIVTGRGYLRMWLEATALGFAGWPMAALSDDETARAALEARFAVPQDHEIIQVLRFGGVTGHLPPRSRRPIDEVAL